MDALTWNAASVKEPAPSRDDGEPVVCVSNIGPKEQRKRLIFGTAAFVMGIAIAALLVLSGVDRWWRVGLLLPFYIGGIGFFQARDKT
ncbi:MAG: hypothetical protein KGJ80_08275 [Chloroflexota bacterium]|nr:hypothetical protein [Chloroflexota bacterium]